MRRASILTALLVAALVCGSVHMTEGPAVSDVAGVYESTSPEYAFPTLLTLRTNQTAEEHHVRDFELVSDPNSYTGTWERADGQVRIVFPADRGHVWQVERCIYRLDIDGADLVLRSAVIGSDELEERRGERYVRVR